MPRAKAPTLDRLTDESADRAKRRCRLCHHGIGRPPATDSALRTAERDGPRTGVSVPRGLHAAYPTTAPVTTALLTEDLDAGGDELSGRDENRRVCLIKSGLMSLPNSGRSDGVSPSWWIVRSAWLAMRATSALRGVQARLSESNGFISPSIGRYRGRRVEQRPRRKSANGL